MDHDEITSKKNRFAAANLDDPAHFNRRFFDRSAKSGLFRRGALFRSSLSRILCSRPPFHGELREIKSADERNEKEKREKTKENKRELSVRCD